MASNEPKELDRAQEADDRLEQFLENAAPILAVARGLNAKSRVKLAALASDIGLADGQFKDAIRALQAAPSASGAEEDPSFVAFSRFLHARLIKLPHGILTTEIEARAVMIAKRNYRLEEEQALKAIRQVAAAKNIRRVSLREAERHLAALVEEIVADSAWIDLDSTKRLHSAGREWGLKAKQVDRIIVEQTAENQRRQKKERWLTIVALALGAAFTIALVGFIFAIMLPEKPTETGADSPSPPVAGGSEETRPIRPKRVGPPPWWDVDLSISLSQARINISSFGPIYNEMASAEADKRAAAYGRLVELVRQDRVDRKQLALLRSILSGCYVLEESDANADLLRDGVLDLARSDIGQLPETLAAYRNAFWAVDVCLSALRHGELSQQRSASMLAALERTLGTKIDSGEASDQLDQQCFEALTRSLYQQLRLGAARSPHLAHQLHQTLMEYVKKWLAFDKRQRLDAEFLVAALPSAGDGWRQYDELIKDAVFSEDPLNTLKTIKVYEQTSDPLLQSYLADLLRLRTRMNDDMGTVAETAEAFRKKLGVKPSQVAETARDRWRLLRGMINEARKDRPNSTKDQAELLQQVVEISHLATLASAVAQQEPGFPIFDQLLDRGLPRISESESEDDDESSDSFDRALRGGTVTPPTNAHRESLLRFIDSLASYQKHSPSQRLTYLRGLASLTERFEEIEPSQGVAIASYLLAPKTADEQQRLLEPAKSVLRWKYVRLALADGLVTAKLPKDQLSELLSVALARTVNIEDSASSPESMRQQLLRDVMNQLSSEPKAEIAIDASKTFDRAAAIMHQLYRTRARALGVGPSQYNATSSPAKTLELLTLRSASLLSGASLKAKDRRLISDLPHEMAVIDYLGGNDIQRTVLLQRLWLRLVSIEVSRKRADRAERATRIVEALLRQDAESETLIVQLKNGEEATLDMWMLLAP